MTLTERTGQLLGREALTATLTPLVRIDSQNPSTGGPAGGEAAVMARAAEFLGDHGIQAELWEALPGRPNLTARIPGRDDSRTLLFETHVDTVSAAGMSIDPFGAVVREGRLWGRGSTDAKGQATAMLHALAALKDAGETPATGIELALVVDEEAGFGGVNALVRRLRERGRLGEIAGAVVGEPTGLEVVVAHKGSVRWRVELRGRSAHTSKPHLGVNAIRHAAALVELIEDRYAAKLRERSHPLLGHPTINVSMIDGGTQINLVPDRARLLLDRRTIPGETRAGVFGEMEELISELKSRFATAEAVQHEPLMVDPCLETDPGHPLVRAALRISAGLGRGGRPRGEPYCTDASKLSEAGIATIVAGPGSIDQAHTPDEWIELGELERGARFFYDLMRAEWGS